MAGLTVATVAVPQAMAYATIAGIPPLYGLYTAVVMTAVGALFDSSRQLINGPTNAISIALLSALAFVPDADKHAAAVVLGLLVGLFVSAKNRGGELKLVSPKKRIKDVLRRTNLDKIFRVYGNDDEAVAAFRKEVA